MEVVEIDIADDGVIAAGVDIDDVIDGGGVRELIAVLNTYHAVRRERRTLDRVQADDTPAFAGTTATGMEMRQALTEGLKRWAEVSPRQALAANHRLVELLMSSRWAMMRDARDIDDSWTVIGQALRMSKQAASSWFQRNAADYDTDHARKALDERNDND